MGRVVETPVTVTGYFHPAGVWGLLYPDAHRKAELRFLKRHTDLKARYRKTLEMLGQDPFHPSLRLRPLKGHLAGLHSAPLSLQYRITLELEIREREIVLVSIGSHDEVY